MQKIDQARKVYTANADEMSTKSRFGFFSVLPSHTAGVTYYPKKICKRDENGRPLTKDRNIYSGINSTGNLKKNYFSYVPSPFHGSQYQDPGKNDRRKSLEASRKWKDHQVFKPAKLNKTLMSSSYAYMPQQKKTSKKQYRDSDGRVKTENYNIVTNPQSKVEFQKNKNFRYVEDPIDQMRKHFQKEKSQELGMRREEPFRTGKSKIQHFSNNVQAFYDSDLSKKPFKKSRIAQAAHEGAFRPNSTKINRTFNRVVYKEEGLGKEKKTKKQVVETNAEKFKLTHMQKNSKPSPSISCSKIMLMRSCR